MIGASEKPGQRVTRRHRPGGLVKAYKKKHAAKSGQQFIPFGYHSTVRSLRKELNDLRKVSNGEAQAQAASSDAPQHEHLHHDDTEVDNPMDQDWTNDSSTPEAYSSTSSAQDYFLGSQTASTTALKSNISLSRRPAPTAAQRDSDKDDLFSAWTAALVALMGPFLEYIGRTAGKKILEPDAYETTCVSVTCAKSKSDVTGLFADRELLVCCLRPL